MAKSAYPAGNGRNGRSPYAAYISMIAAKSLFNRAPAARSSLIILLAVLIVTVHNRVQAGAVDLAGRIEASRGRVTVSRLGVLEPIEVGAAEPAFEVFVGDKVAADEGGSARLSFDDGSFVNIGGNGAIRVIQYIYEPAANRLKVHIKALKGRARFIQYKRMAPGSVFIVESPTAMASATAADFVVAAFDEKTSVAALEGAVSVRNINNLAVGNVTLHRNRKTTVAEKASPSGPEALGPDERKELTRELSFLNSPAR